MNLDFILTLGYTVGKTILIFLGLNAKVGKFGLSKFNMMHFLRVFFYALLSFLLADSEVSVINAVLIITVVLTMDIMVAKRNEQSDK